MGYDYDEDCCILCLTRDGHELSECRQPDKWHICLTCLNKDTIENVGIAIHQHVKDTLTYEEYCDVCGQHSALLISAKLCDTHLFETKLTD
jgi:hypothetical protein